MRVHFPTFMKMVRRREDEALKLLVDRYQSLAQRAVRQHLGPRLRCRVESADLLHDFWLSIFRRVDRLPELANSIALRAYLRKVAFRQVTKQQRRHLKAACRSLDRQVSQVDLNQFREKSVSDTTACECSSHGELLDHLQSQATELEWRIVQMKIQGESNREIGRRLRIDEGSVRRSLRQMGRVAAKFATNE